MTAGGRDGSATNQRFLGAYARFDTTQNPVIGVSVSYTGYEGARKNREAEATVTEGDTTRPRTFDEARAAAKARWNDELGRIAIDGGTQDDQKVFYTSLYHAVLHPDVGSDVDGACYGADTVNHVATGWTYYQNYSLWDTYRSENQFLSLLHPNESRDMMRSIRPEAGRGPQGRHRAGADRPAPGRHRQAGRRAGEGVRGRTRARSSGSLERAPAGVRPSVRSPFTPSPGSPARAR